MALGIVTAVGTPLSSAYTACLANQVTGLVVLMVGDTTKNSTILATANLFSPGCIFINAGGSSTTTNVYVNSATAASPTWTALTIN